MASKKKSAAEQAVTANAQKVKGNAISAFNAVAQGHLQAPDVRRVDLNGKKRVTVVTWAQAYTPVHKGFLKALESYCEKNDGSLHVMTSDYKGTAVVPKSQVETTPKFDPAIEEYLLTDENKMSKINDSLAIGGELQVSPTSKNPCSGFHNYFHGASGIIGHPRVAMESLPSIAEDSTRFLYTTGAITQRNYKPGKAGQQAEFYHTYGALVIEEDSDGTCFVRQIAADEDGSFYELTGTTGADKYLPNGQVLRNQRVEAVTLGDIHIEKNDPVQDQIVLDKGGMLDVLAPKHVFIHDIIDFMSRNHHNILDPFFRFLEFVKKATVESALQQAFDFLKKVERPDRKVVVAKGNHDRALDRWLAEADARYDVENAIFYHDCTAEKLRRIKAGDMRFDPLAWAINKLGALKNVVFLQETDSYIICKGDKETGGGIECGMHGHIGLNGARGSSENLRRLPQKVNRGHDHSAGIKDGVWTSGVQADLDMGYNLGPSSWSHSHTIVYPNGKRAMVTIKNGKWRANCKRVKPAPLNQNKKILSFA